MSPPVDIDFKRSTPGMILVGLNKPKALRLWVLLGNINGISRLLKISFAGYYFVRFPHPKHRCFIRCWYRMGKRGELFRSRYTLLKAVERLTDGDKARLNQLFYCYPELEKAWVLKESLRECYRETNRSIAEERLRLIEERIANDSLAEFRELLRILSNWRAEILNYFDYRITNGFVEGKNNRIKTIKRTAYPSREGP
jgi:hypothetical protein